MTIELKDKLDVQKISCLRSAIREFLVSNGIGEEIVDDIELVVSEILTNIYKHSYRGRNEEVHIKVVVCEKKIEISIRDFGKKFAPSNATELDPEILADHGYGLYIASQIMDKIEYVLSHEVGTETILIKYLEKNG